MPNFVLLEFAFHLLKYLAIFFTASSLHKVFPISLITKFTFYL